MRFNLAITLAVAAMALVMPESVAADDCGLAGRGWVCCITKTGRNCPNQRCFPTSCPVGYKKTTSCCFGKDGLSCLDGEWSEES
ncbi:hypothetical protein BGZ81_004593 [Podila clonocystis]|nr:hypothetical protein BGZ81_004593 [Podila clonocystis]